MSLDADAQTLYNGAWKALTGRDEPWGGCARREEVERIAEFAADWRARSAPSDEVRAIVNTVLAQALPHWVPEGDVDALRQELRDRLADALDGLPTPTPPSDSLLVEVRLGREYEAPNADGSEPGGWFARVESARVIAGNLTEDVCVLAEPYASELDYDGMVQEAIASHMRPAVPAAEDTFATARPCREGDAMCVDPWPCQVHDRKPTGRGPGDG